MQDINIQILCTRPLNESLLESAREEGIGIDTIPFIETEAIQSIEIQQEIELALAKSAVVVFTSMNAVEAVAYYAEEQPEWRIYCVGNATTQLVKEHFGDGSVADTATDAANLAELIVEEEEPGEEIIFFCGDQRREELPAILESNGFELTELVVYHTIAVPHKINKAYSGILFFSPSAVDSFFSVNKVNGQTILFAIGNTTAQTIKKYAANKIVVGDEPGKDALVETMLEFFRH